MNPFFFELIPPVPDPSKFEEILFVDRDGVVIVEKNYIKDPRELEFIPGSIDALHSRQIALWQSFPIKQG